jgi:hypothetical protein
MWANAIGYLFDTGHSLEARAYEEVVVSEEAPDWMQLFARVGVAIDPVNLTNWLKKRPEDPDHLVRLDEVRLRLINRRRLRTRQRDATNG